MKFKVLVVDDDESIHSSLKLSFIKSFSVSNYEAEYAYSCEEAMSIFEQDPYSYALAFIDYQYKEDGKISVRGHLLAHRLKEINPCLTTVMMSGDKSKDALSDWLKAGVDKFLYKPLSTDSIHAILENAIESYSSQFFRTQKSKGVTEYQKKVGLAGHSENIKSVCKLAVKYASSDEAALILGETGTGKELVAQAIHDNSKRSKGPFVVVNCAAISNSLFESELFGHIRGAFTDAKADKLGKFREADRGTIFLDEIHHLNLSQQAALLRVIQEKQVQPVGGKQPVTVDFRIVVAGKQNLRELTESGDFLPDLYFRIKHLDLTILPLRERPEDILPTVAHIQNKLERESGESKQLMKAAIDKMLSYSWPGNVRELIGEIKRLYLVVDSHMIRDKDLSNCISDQKSFSFYSTETNQLISMEELEAYQKKQQIALIIKALKQSKNNISQASILLNMRRTTLASKMEAYGLKNKDIGVLDMILNTFSKNKGGTNENKSHNMDSAISAIL